MITFLELLIKQKVTLGITADDTDKNKLYKIFHQSVNRVQFMHPFLLVKETI